MQITENSSDKQKAIQGYQKAFKSTALFGGVQVVNIILSIIKSKFVAIWLGPNGFGLMSLFSTTINLIFSISNIGLQSSAVRDIAIAHAQEDKYSESKIVNTINRWVILTGIAGAIITIVMSPLLCKWFFDSNKYIVSFVLLSSVVFLTSIYNGHYATLQGTRNLKLLAKANIYGSLIGFILSMPLLYFFKNDGIVWSLIVSTLSITIISYIFVRRLNLIKIDQTYKQSLINGYSTIKLGAAMSVAGITTLVVEFILKTYITQDGGIEDVGLFQTGWTLNGLYLGMVFTAISKDYFPRLSEKSQDNRMLEILANQQAEIAILLLAPLIIIMTVFLPFFIRLLYTTEFLEVIPMTICLFIGSFIKAGSWGISYIYLAKRDIKIYLINELGIQALFLPAYIFGFAFFGLVGIGYAYILCYTIYFCWINFVAKRRYNIIYKNSFWKLFLIFLFLLLLSPITTLFFNLVIIDYILFCVVICYSIYELNKRIFIYKILLNIFLRNGR